LGRPRLELSRPHLRLGRRHRTLDATVGLNRTWRGHHRRPAAIRAVELLPVLCRLLAYL
jgi:hypothetical protein